MREGGRQLRAVCLLPGQLRGGDGWLSGKFSWTDTFDVGLEKQGAVSEAGLP